MVRSLKWYNNTKGFILIIVKEDDMNSIEQRATEILKDAYGQSAEFRKGQLEAIVSVVSKHKTLVVQKTGWGKSLVYFIATKILRQRGAGPTIIVSPLLALMNNQIDSADVLGIKAITINSANRDQWDYLYQELHSYDAIIVSPERLSDEMFMNNLQSVKRIELFVVDEAHSISDWGHDFRPDYQRIVKLLKQLPKDIAILGTTATANNRVIDDIKSQLGSDLVVSRGALMRDNLSIQINPKQTREERLAWITQALSFDERLHNEQGIIYCLTQRDCETVANFLKVFKISAESYHSGLGLDEDGANIAEQRLLRFHSGKTKVLVSTIKLGMGYDKSDIRFIIHYQLPENLISYYQQIGRSGRDGILSYVFLLHGYEDEEILDYFIQGSQSQPALLSNIIELCKKGAKQSEILSKLNISYGKLNEALKYLQVNDYLIKDKSIYFTNDDLVFNCFEEKIKQENLNAIRYEELEKLKQYVETDQCMMHFIATELDSPDKNENCGICANCLNREILSFDVNPVNLNYAERYLHSNHGVIEPRKQWPNRQKIVESERMKEGWVLTNDYYSTLGKLVQKGKNIDRIFSQELVSKSAEFLKDKVKLYHIDLIVAVPSLRTKDLVPRYARAVANLLNVTYEDAIIKTKNTPKQNTKMNSAMQYDNIRDTFKINETVIQGKTILLMDDMIESTWTLTVIASDLLKAGAHAVYPFSITRIGG